MKTQMFRVGILGLVAIGSLAVGTGCHEEQALAEVPDFDKLVPQLVQTAPASNIAPVPAPAKPGADVALEKTAVSTNAAMPKLVANPVIPENLKVSPALEEVLKLAQAGVSEDVMLAYITNSTTFFNVGSDVVIYLNDLGVPNNVITTLIQHDATPEMQARRQAAGAVQPLPPGVALNTPATNIYPPAVSQTAPPPSPDTGAAPPPPADAEVTTVAAPAEEPANVSYFYSSLAPYGTWMEVDGYGLCWQPTVVVSNPGWRPYSDRGRWLWSNHGWYWYSDYSWGWAPYHYGRWCDYPRVGWIWVPGTTWGPSWVSWRYSSAYCGWAPLPPSCYYSPYYGFSYYGSYVGVGFEFGLGFSSYCYVPTYRFCDRSPGLYVLPAHRARAVHRETTVVNNYVTGNNNTIVNNGVGRDRIAAATRGQIPTATVREGATRGSVRREQLVNEGSSLAIVRPSLPEKPDRSHVAVPSRNLARVRATDSSGAAVGASTRGATAENTPGVSVTRSTTSTIGNRSSQTVTRERTVSQPGSSGAAAPQTAAANSGSETRSRPVTAPRESLQSANARPNVTTFRTYNEPASANNSGVTRQSPQVAGSQNTAPQASASPAAPRSLSPVSPAARTAPNVTRPITTPSATPNTASRPDMHRSYANPGAVNRPAAQAPPSRPAPAASAPASRPSVSSAPVSRPEPSRSYSAPSYSAPSYSAPARSYSAPSYSAPASRPSAPSYSAPSSSPSRGSSGVTYGGGGGRSGGRGRD